MTIQEKRTHLQELSKKAADIREKMLHDCTTDEEIQALNLLSVNQMLIRFFYTKDDHREFKSFKGWMKEKKCVKKGEKAFLVWGKPTEKKEDGTEKPIIENEDGRTFFPISYIFSNAQVKDL